MGGVSHVYVSYLGSWVGFIRTKQPTRLEKQWYKHLYAFTMMGKKDMLRYNRLYLKLFLTAVEFHMSPNFRHNSLSEPH